MEHRFPCAGCGADLEWDPGAASMKCPYCGRTQQVSAPVAAAVREHALDDYLHAGPAQLARLSATALQVTCSGCGSVVTFEPPEVAGFCPFCAARLVAQPVAADPLIAPEGVLPFIVPRKDATRAIQQWLATRWFAPNALKKLARQDSIGGVYLPFWTYDACTQTAYRGERGDHYYETEVYYERDANGQQVRRERQVQKTRWWPAHGTVARDFDDILISATESVDRNRLDALQPWDLAQAQPFAPAFLAGFKAQRYQVDLGAGFELAKGVMDSAIRGDIRQDIGGDEQRIHHYDTRHWDCTFKHLLLPVWLAAYRYRGKSYQVAVNARTGEVSGERPYSVWKILGLILLIAVGIALFHYLGQERPPAS